MYVGSPAISPEIGQIDAKLPELFEYVNRFVGPPHSQSENKKISKNEKNLKVGFFTFGHSERHTMEVMSSQCRHMRV